jgi:hypothetical protein
MPPQRLAAPPRSELNVAYKAAREAVRDSLAADALSNQTKPAADAAELEHHAACEIMLASMAVNHARVNTRSMALAHEEERTVYYGVWETCIDAMSAHSLAKFKSEEAEAKAVNAAGYLACLW